MTSETITEALSLSDDDKYFIEDAACLWLSVDPHSKKGEFLKEYGELMRSRIVEDYRRQNLPLSIADNAEEQMFDNAFEDLMILLQYRNPFIDNKRLISDKVSRFTPEQITEINNNTDKQLEAFNDLVFQFNQLVMKIYERSDIEHYLEKFIKPGFMRKAAKNQMVNQLDPVDIDSLTDAGVRRIIRDFILMDDPAGMNANSEIFISRNELLCLAKYRNEIPEFLFSPLCGAAEPDGIGVSRKNLHTTFYILARKLNYISGENVFVSKAQRAIGLCGLCIDDKTMRKYLTMDPHMVKIISNKRNPRQETALLTCIHAFSQKLGLTPNSVDEIQKLLSEKVAPIRQDDFVECLDQAKNHVKAH